MSRNSLGLEAIAIGSEAIANMNRSSGVLASRGFRRDLRRRQVICERFGIPDDVAGATLMALGCNGPELALNMCLGDGVMDGTGQGGWQEDSSQHVFLEAWERASLM